MIFYIIAEAMCKFRFLSNNAPSPRNLQILEDVHDVIQNLKFLSSTEDYLNALFPHAGSYNLTLSHTLISNESNQ